RNRCCFAKRSSRYRITLQTLRRSGKLSGVIGETIAVSNMNRSFAGSMPELYDRVLVPVMFEPFAQDLAERLRRMTSGHILEIAAGTGVVMRADTGLVLRSRHHCNRSEPRHARPGEIPFRFGSRPMAGGRCACAAVWRPGVR